MRVCVCVCVWVCVKYVKQIFWLHHMSHTHSIISLITNCLGQYFLYFPCLIYVLNLLAAFPLGKLCPWWIWMTHCFRSLCRCRAAGFTEPVASLRVQGTMCALLKVTERDSTDTKKKKKPARTVIGSSHSAYNAWMLWNKKNKDVNIQCTANSLMLHIKNTVTEVIVGKAEVSSTIDQTERLKKHFKWRCGSYEKSLSFNDFVR